MAKSDKTVEALSAGQGAIISRDGKQLAAFKDESGAVTLLNPKCPHLGCLVDWDSAKKQWVCPCHASEFEATGKVLKGPAKKNLEKLD